jgi:hypothetical protein
MNTMAMHVASSVLCLTVAAASAGELAAGNSPDAPDTFGTGLTVYPMPAVNFTPLHSSAAYTSAIGMDRFTDSYALVAAPVLPNGALIERIELRACDTSATGGVTAIFQACPTAGSACVPLGTAGTSAAGTPGCGDFIEDIVPPLVVDNRTTPLMVGVGTGPSAQTTFSMVKLYYRLRVSPAPATATFPNDVPTTHPFFRFIEALAAAGITGGCAGSSFCPDAAVTRGQMAVFLATALGLHFPN